MASGSTFGDTKWKEREKRIFDNPNCTIADCNAAEYKYFSLFRDLAASYSETHDTESFQRRLRIIRKSYNEDIAYETQALLVYREYQKNIKRCTDSLQRLTRGEFKDTYEALTLALDCISAMRGETVTEKTVLERLEGKGLP